MSPSLVETIKEGRNDLTQYVIHFTRKEGGQSAFDILKAIVSDGYLKCGWSQRGRRRTIFGKKPAVCFTETPLCGFLNYVDKRKHDKISKYGIFLRKTDFFKAGARPVIYGTTLEPRECPPDHNGEQIIDGFSDSEQYRYILTTGIDKQNDWTHEREWRWANWQGYSELDEIMPLWKIGQKAPFPNFNFRFSPIGIIVNTSSEAQEVQEILHRNLLAELEEKERRRGVDAYLDSYIFSGASIFSTKIIVLQDFTVQEQISITIESILKEKRHHNVHQFLTNKGVPYDAP